MNNQQLISFHRFFDINQAHQLITGMEGWGLSWLTNLPVVQPLSAPFQAVQGPLKAAGHGRAERDLIALQLLRRHVLGTRGWGVNWVHYRLDILCLNININIYIYICVWMIINHEYIYIYIHIYIYRNLHCSIYIYVLNTPIYAYIYTQMHHQIDR